MGFDLEGAGPAVANIDDAGILARPLDHAIALGRQAFEMYAGGLVGAMLAPHHAIDSQLREAGRAAEGLDNALIFLRCDAVLLQKLRAGGQRGHGRRGRFHGCNSIVAWGGCLKSKKTRGGSESLGKSEGNQRRVRAGEKTAPTH